MDDTPRRVSDDAMTGRASADLSARGDESMRGLGPDDDRQGAPHDDGEPNTAEIRRDIEQTREEISETIDAIQDKLRPANLVSSATDTIKHATTERVRQMTHSAGNAASSMMYGGENRSGGIVGSIRDNPMPAALIGIGAAWLFMSRRSGGSGGEYDARSQRYGRGLSGREWPTRRSAYERDAEDLESRGRELESNYPRGAYSRSRADYGEQEDRTSGILDRVMSNPVPAALAGIGLGWLAFAENDGDDDRGYRNSDRYGYRYGTESETGESAMSRVSETVSDAASSVSDTAEQMTARAQDYAQDATARARRTGRRAQNELQRMTQENPLAVGAGALLLGALVGLSIPETERENEMLGETRDSMVDKAQQMARDATSRAQDAAADLVTDAASRIVGGKTE
jgi:hypothetical protein